MPEVVHVERRGRRLTIEFADAPPLECDREFAVARQFVPGQLVEPAILARLRDEAARHRAEIEAVRMLARRPASEREVRRRLQTKALTPDAIDAAIASLRRQGYLDDAAFAAHLTETRVRRRPTSARAIRNELAQHGVDTATAAQATAALNDDALALEIARTRMERSPTDWETYERRVGAMLQRRGFSHGVTRRALRQAWEEGGAAPPPDA